ncbi:MAG: ATP-binding protein [Saprospiraceae bacterium]
MSSSTWRFPSTPHSIGEIENLVEQLASKYCISQDKFPNILISLTEAVNNAIIHGNNCDECKCVHIEIEQRPNQITLIVRDEGFGFDPDKVDDPTLPENIAKAGGRGIFLIRQLCDKVNYESNGTEVKMSFDI